MIFDKELRNKVKIQRNAVHDLLKYHLPKYDLTKIGDSELQLSWTSNDYSIRSTAIECTMYGDWEFVEVQDECNDNWRYSMYLYDDTQRVLNSEDNANDIVNALMKILKS